MKHGHLFRHQNLYVPSPARAPAGTLRMLRPATPLTLHVPACGLSVSLRPHTARARPLPPRLHAFRAFTGSDIALLCIWGLYMLQLVHAALEER